MKDRGYTLMGHFPAFEVLKGLNQGHSVTEIAQYRKVTRRSVYKVLSTLMKRGMVEKRGYGVYTVTEKGVKGIHSLVGLRYNLRQHNLHLKIAVLESPRNWNLRRNEIRFLPYFNRVIKLKNNEQEMFNFGKMQIRTTTKSIIVKMPTLYARDWEHAFVQAMAILEDNLYKIEHLFKIKLVKDYKANITIISQEYARIQDALAKLYRKEENRVYLTGDDGKIWLITDFSFSTDELEFIHPDKATDDVDAIAPFLNDLRAHPTTLSEVRGLVGSLAAVQQAHAQNIIKHQRVMDDISDGLKKLNSLVEQWHKKENARSARENTEP